MRLALRRASWARVCTGRVLVAFAAGAACFVRRHGASGRENSLAFPLAGGGSEAVELRQRAAAGGPRVAQRQRYPTPREHAIAPISSRAVDRDGHVAGGLHCSAYLTR